MKYQFPEVSQILKIRRINITLLERTKNLVNSEN